MQEFKLEHPPSQTGASLCPVAMVVVGHVGLATVRTPDDERTSPGGSGYAVAASAAALIGRRVGLVAQVGSDLDLSPLRRLGVNLDGVTELPGPSAKLRIEQFEDGKREFSADLGVAKSAQVGSFPLVYLHAEYIHLGTAPPQQQLAWLEFLSEHGCTAQVSADMFEHYVDRSPDASRKVCDTADLVFMNEAEYAGLYGLGEYTGKAPLILKRGPDGASLIADGPPQDVKAPPADVVDPTGGGEILAGVFLALCADGVPEIEALDYAARAAASCVEEFGVYGPRLAASLERIRLELGTCP
jgi:sugar/nucleoside kinase (ribokinase family)